VDKKPGIFIVFFLINYTHVISMQIKKPSEIKKNHIFYSYDNVKQSYLLYYRNLNPITGSANMLVREVDKLRSVYA
jgi:hypothetical protein